MSDDKALNILKSAILLERKGRALYSKVAQQTDSAAAREFFELMAREEEDHCTWLEKQFVHFSKNKEFVDMKVGQADPGISDDVLTTRLKKEISAAGYEAAAIGAAMSMEEQAIRIYSERSQATQDVNERKIYAALVAFEKEHLEKLARINREITESVWADNQFWPF